MTEITIPFPGDLMLDELRLFTPRQVNRSEWTGTRKVIGGTGREIWRGHATIADIATEDDERHWRAFLFGLDGQVNWFRWVLPCNTHIGAKPVVASGAGDAYTLPLSGMQPNARILRAGQFMTVPLPSGHWRAVCLSADLMADGSGNATASFTPALGEVPTLAATVETVDPFIPMSLTNGEQGFSLTDGTSGTAFDVDESK